MSRPVINFTGQKLEQEDVLLRTKDSLGPRAEFPRCAENEGKVVYHGGGLSQGDSQEPGGP